MRVLANVNVLILLVIHPFRPLKGKPKPNANTNIVDKTCIGCFALVSPLGDGRGPAISEK